MQVAPQELAEVEEVIDAEVVVAEDLIAGGQNFCGFCVQGLGAEAGKVCTEGFRVRLLGVVLVEKLIKTCRQPSRDVVQSIELGLDNPEGALAAFEVDAGHAFVGFDFEDLQQTDLAGRGRGRAAARHAVGRARRVAHGDDGDVFVEGECFPQRVPLRFFAGLEVVDVDRKVLCDYAVGLRLCGFCHFPGDALMRGVLREGDVDGDVVVAHVEAFVPSTVQAVESPAQNVLAQMPLHVVETVRPVDLLGDGHTGLEVRNLFRRDADNGVSLLENVRDREAPPVLQREGAPVAALPAAGRKEDGLVCNDLRACRIVNDR